MNRLQLCLLTLATLLASPLCADSASSMLLFVQSAIEGIDQGQAIPPLVKEVTIYRDGLVLVVFRAGDGSQRISRYQAPEATMAWFREQLSFHRIAFAQGDCGVSPPEAGTFRTVRVTWFGRPPREHTFEIRAPGAPSCAPDTESLFRDIELLEDAALLAPGGPGVSLSDVADPLCEAQ